VSLRYASMCHLSVGQIDTFGQGRI
jgi:hypothetical protein